MDTAERACQNPILQAHRAHSTTHSMAHKLVAQKRMRLPPGRAYMRNMLSELLISGERSRAGSFFSRRQLRSSRTANR